MAVVTNRISITIDVLGRASTRWRSAKNKAAADTKNAALSLKRAALVADLFRTAFTEKFDGDPNYSGLLIRTLSSPKISGAGSKGAIGRGDMDDNPLDRVTAVTVLWTFDTTRLYPNELQSRKVRYKALSTDWLAELSAISAKIEAGKDSRVEATLRFINLLSSKSRSYKATLTGRGVDTGGSATHASAPVGRFTTASPVGFDAFEGKAATLSMLKIGAGVQKTRYRLALGMGGSSGEVDMVTDESATVVSFGQFEVKGSLVASEPNPGDDREETEFFQADRVDVSNSSTQVGLLVPFATGSSTLTKEMTAYVRNFATQQALNLKTLAYQLKA